MDSLPERSIYRSGERPPRECEVCGLPHEPDAIKCEECGHQLDTLPDWEALRADLGALKLQVGLSLAGVAGLIAVAAFGGGFYLVSIGPVAWFVVSTYRHQRIARYLRRVGQLR